MRIPRRINIAPGVVYAVKYKKKIIHGGYECSGLCDPRGRSIYIESGLDKKERVRTFLHELIHAIDFETFNEFKIKERDVRKLESTLYYVIKTLFGAPKES